MAAISAQAIANTFRPMDAPWHSRGTNARGLDVVPLEMRGAGNAGCALHPRSRVQECTKKSAHEHTGSAEAVRHSLRNGFTAYAVLSSATNSSCHRRPADSDWPKPGWADASPLDLASATDARTTRFCRTQPAPFVLRAVTSLTSSASPCDQLARRRCRVHRIPSRVRDDRDTPLLPGKDGASW